MLAAISTASATAAAHAQSPQPWSFFGADTNNTRSSLSPAGNINSTTQISPRNAARLALKWTYSTVGDVSATPTVEAGGLYVPDYAGWLYKLDPASGGLLWKHQLSDYVGAYAYSRGSPAIGAMNDIVLGIGSNNTSSKPGARVVAINKTTGNLIWQTIVDTTTHSYITTSPVIYNGRVYFGVASSEEVVVHSTPGFVPTFRGSVVALNEATGKIDWQFETVPPGYTGASVWGSSPAIYKPGNAVLIGTGNNITISAAATKCLATAGTSVTSQLACLDVTDYVDSLLSLDLVTGHLNWARRFEVDTWNGGCGSTPPSGCPTPAGRDDDFAQAPGLAYLSSFVGVPDDRGGTAKNYLLGIGQKSGYYRGLDPANGGLFWSTYLGQGQLLFGSAIDTDDGSAAYAALYNQAHYGNTLAGRNGVAVHWNAGAWASIATATGKVNWQVPTYGADVSHPQYGGAAPGPVTFSNRIVFAGSSSGYMVALDANSGYQYWKFNAGGSVLGGPSIYNETVYWGAGANSTGAGSVHKVFAFAVPPPD